MAFHDQNQQEEKKKKAHTVGKPNSRSFLSSSGIERDNTSSVQREKPTTSERRESTGIIREGRSQTTFYGGLVWLVGVGMSRSA